MGKFALFFLGCAISAFTMTRLISAPIQPELKVGLITVLMGTAIWGMPYYQAKWVRQSTRKAWQPGKK